MKSITICGEGYASLALSLGGILASLGEKVMISDAASDSPIDFVLRIPKEIDVKSDIYQVYGCDYTQMDVPASGHDVVINLTGTRGCEGPSDILIAVFKETGECYAKMQNVSFPECGASFLLIEDSLGLMSREYRAFAKQKGIKDIETLKINKKDVAARLRLELNGELSIRKASGGQQKLLYGLVKRVLPETEEKAFEKAVKKCEKGGHK